YRLTRYGRSPALPLEPHPTRVARNFSPRLPAGLFDAYAATIQCPCLITQLRYPVCITLQGRKTQASRLACLLSPPDVYTPIEEASACPSTIVWLAWSASTTEFFRPTILAGPSAFGRLSWARGLIFTPTYTRAASIAKCRCS